MMNRALRGLTLVCLFAAATSCGRRSSSQAGAADSLAALDPPPPEAMSTLPHPQPQRAAAASKRVRPTIEAALYAQDLRFGDPVFIRAFKKERVLEVFVQCRESARFRLFREYPVAGASGVLGPKLREGDKQVPEGFYFVPASAMNPASRFHLSFNVGFPNAFDRHHGRTGSLIMVHGGRASIGCLAMTDPAIEEIYVLADAAHRSGQSFFRVHIFPFRMTDANLAAHGDSPWREFWDNLREGYDWFEQHGVPPDASLSPAGRYQFQHASRQ